VRPHVQAAAHPTTHVQKGGYVGGRYQSPTGSVLDAEITEK
jgi:hypothetical protein